MRISKPLFFFLLLIGLLLIGPMSAQATSLLLAHDYSWSSGYSYPHSLTRALDDATGDQVTVVPDFTDLDLISPSRCSSNKKESK